MSDLKIKEEDKSELQWALMELIRRAIKAGVIKKEELYDIE